MAGKTWIYGTLAAALLANAVVAEAPPAAAPPVPAGAYTIDHAHASLLFRVNHMGFSNFTARFRKFDADLQFDPRNIAASHVTVRVAAASIETDYPDPATLDFNAQLRGAEWLDAKAHPQMIFESSHVVSTGKQSFRIEGTLTIRGVTNPMTLLAQYNGGYAGHPMDPHARIGFSAHGHLQRSAFGMTVGIPAPGTTMGVSDDVEVIIELELSGPPLAKK
jgi:polyisoprenoid-binding protein YceI